MPPHDPTADMQPNFEDEAWEGARNAIMEGGKSAEEATEILERAWTAKHDRDTVLWNEYLQQRQQEIEQDEERERQGPEDAGGEQLNEPEEPEWVNRPTPSFLDIKPARHVVKRLEKKEFVELWHFTAEGCREAAMTDLATPDDTFSLVNTDKGIFLQTLGASSSSSKVIKDENLSWNQLTEAKTRMVGCLKACGWSEHEVSQLIMFYLSLDTHPIRSQPYGLEAIMRYQSRVRRDWIARLRTGDSYSIAAVNDDLMREYRDEIRNEEQARNNVSVHFERF